MKLSIPRKNRTPIIAGVALLAIATPSFAIFGLGDIVFDPSAYAQMLIEKSQRLAELAKLESQLQTAYKTYTTAMTTYNTIHSNLQRFTKKSMWVTIGMASLKKANVANQYGETDGFTEALNKFSAVAADTAWTASKVGVVTGVSVHLKGHTPGSDPQLSQLAHIEAVDAVSPTCLSAVGAYQDARVTNAVAQTALETADLDETDGTNSEVEQLNLLNAANAQQANEMRAQGLLHSCMAAQLTLASLQQRNASAADLNLWSQVKDTQAANPTFNVMSSSTYTTYLP